MMRRNAVQVFLGVVAASALTGCLGGGPSVATSEGASSAGGSSGDLPGWVTSPPSKKGFAYGVGSAEIHADPSSALNRAQDQARTELIKRMEVTVSGRTTAQRSRKVEAGKSRVTRSIMDKVESRVPETELANIEIAKTHAVEGGDTAFALARLNRSQAEMTLIDKIEDMDARIREIAEKDPGGDDRLARLKALMPALPLFQERSRAMDKLQLVAEQDPGHRLPSELRDLRDRITGLLDSLVVVLKPRGGSDRKMDSTLRKSLANEGVQVRESGKGDLTLRYEAGVRTVARDDRHFVFADGNVTVLDPDGNVIDEFQGRVKAGSVDPGVARDRAIGELAQSLGGKLGEALLDSFERAAGR